MQAGIAKVCFADITSIRCFWSEVPAEILSRSPITCKNNKCMPMCSFSFFFSFLFYFLQLFSFLIFLMGSSVSCFCSCSTRRQLCYQHGISAWHCMSWWFNEIKAVSHTCPLYALDGGKCLHCSFIIWVRGIFSKVSLCSSFPSRDRQPCLLFQRLALCIRAVQRPLEAQVLRGSKGTMDHKN